LLSIIRDITERKKAEERIRENHRWLRESQRIARIGSYIFDIQADSWTSSEELNELFGIAGTYNKDTNSWFAIIHPDDREGMSGYFQQDILTNKEPFNRTYRILRPNDRKVLWVMGKGELICNASGNPIKFVGTVQDIIERRNMEEEQRRNRETSERLAKEMAIIAEIGRLIGSTLDIDEVYERFAAETRKLIPFDRLSVSLNNPRKYTQSVAYVSGFDIPIRRQGDTFPLEGTVNETILRTRTGLLIPSANIEDLADRLPGLITVTQAEMRSVMSVPLIYRGEVIGALHFRSKKKDTYTPEDLRLAERIGEQIAGAIASAQLFINLKKTENSLRESEERFRALVEQAGVGVAEIDMGTGRFLTVNRRLCEMVGRTEEEMLAATFQVITHPEDLHLHEDKMALLLAGKIGYYNLEKRYLRKDGAIIWVNITVSPLWKPGEKPGRNMVVVEDITERKRVQEENERRSKQLAALHETSIELTAELNMNTLLHSIVQHALNLIGGTSCNCYLYNAKSDLLERVVSVGPALIPTKTTRQRGEGMTGQVWATGTPLLVNDYRSWPGRTKAYDSFPSRALIAAPFCWGDEFLGVLNIISPRPHQYTQTDVEMLSMFATQTAIIIRNARLYDQMKRDLTERRRLESERKLMQDQLLQSQKMEAIGTLAGGIAHDFNNILMSIQGYISLIQMDLQPDHPGHTRLQKIEEQISSGANLTRQLLGFARGGKYEVKTTNLNDLVEKSAEIFGRTHKEISVSREFQEKLWPVEVDRGQIDQVLLNLYINAWQAMPAGGDLSLTTQNVILQKMDVKPHGVSPGKYLKISVMDTGTGIDEKIRERIFDPFFTTKEPGKGTGLGLASAYGIIRNHGGFITVHSELDKGSTFDIYLPASKKDSVTEEKSPQQKILTGRETILLVDDENSNITVTKEILESLGYQVMIAGSGQEAIALYSEKGNEIDLIVLDLIMPGMGGGKAFDILREIDPSIRVILSSGYSVDGEALQIMERGCNGFIQKPFRIVDISQKIRDVLEN